MKKNRTRVAGHLADKRGIYQMVLSWNINGIRHRKSITTGLRTNGNKKMAEDMLRQTRATQEKWLMTQPVAPTAQNTSGVNIMFADFLLRWFNVAKLDLSPSTRGNYENAIKRVLVPYFRPKHLTLAGVTPEDILAFYAKRMKIVKASTVHKYHNNLTCAFKYAVEKGLIEHSPMERVKRPKVEKYSAKYLRQSEVIALFDAVKGHKLELGVIMAAFYGLRRGEIVGLRWDAIDFEQNTITVNHTLTVAQVNGKKTIVASDTAKTKSSIRTLPLTTEFRSVLLSLKEEKEREQKQCGRSYNKTESEYIYTDSFGKRIRPDYLTAEFPRFLEKNGFKRVRFHDLRHSCASLLIANGVQMKHIQEWLGHSSYKITADTYAHLEYSSKIATAAAMNWISETSLGQMDNLQ